MTETVTEKLQLK